jgi:hypothetical protein
MVGVNFGKNGDNYGIFSPIGSIEQDFGGSLGVFDPGNPPPDPIQVNIQGPFEIPTWAAEDCAWDANVTGGVGPYSYEWLWDSQVVSTESFYVPNGPSAGSHFLEVTVWDSSGSDWDGRTIDVDDAYSC